MEFTSYGFDVYTSEVDDHGIDFIAKGMDGTYYEVQVKNKQKLLFYDCVSKRVITTTQVNSYYKRVCSSVGIESSGQHALRHTFATRCIEAGIPAVVLKTWLGHKDIHMTLDTYTDVFQAMDNDAISKYDEHLNSM